ncbi:uncharacterized protein Tco025E_00337 [Trypanosoma conorhini]|uniref:Leucine-rich repeat protein (LRRP) n=1 Tax=Trypanosoma conorhini TaxID=83891 RepID=A0A422QBS0_9TRYP|nr:uncharacterized protein Tco025E_00337 [Trypanosoma conorhini]RNF27407.1 hypothetical protein Tco025E_00337 [Trypanosoma conorhini]
MGVGQSRELLGKVSEDRVFVCTNREELLELLSTMQQALSAPAEAGSEGGVDDAAPESPGEAAAAAAACVPVEEVRVPNHYLGDDGLLLAHPGVLQLLAASPALRLLDVAYNALTVRAAEALAGGSGTPPNLLSLNLAGNHMGRAGCEKIAAFLSTNPPLRELSLFHNGLYDSDVEPILRSLAGQNTRLRLLNLDCNFLTGAFLRVLLEVLRSNTTLAVVLFDGPYHPETLESLRPAAPVALAPGEADTAANARASLRKKLLRADLAGRPPFPADLAQEVEAILAPRRAEYLAELQAEREAAARSMAEAEAAAAAAAAALRCEDAACSAAEIELSTADGEGMDGDAEQLPADADADAQATGAHSKDGHALASSSHSRLAALEGGRQKVSFLDRVRHGRSPAPASSKEHRRSPTASRASPAPSLKTRLVTGRELYNGFDRLALLPGSHIMGAKTVWHKITGPPCRLRACWCDPRDVAAPYAGVLHYHCKHEPIGGDLGDMSTEGKRLESSKKMTQGAPQRVLQHVISQVSKDTSNGKHIPYDGCKETGHRCESIGFYGNPRPDRSSVYFFASPHPLKANVVEAVSGAT